MENQIIKELFSGDMDYYIKEKIDLCKSVGADKFYSSYLDEKNKKKWVSIKTEIEKILNT